MEEDRRFHQSCIEDSSLSYVIFALSSFCVGRTFVGLRLSVLVTKKAKVFKGLVSLGRNLLI